MISSLRRPLLDTSMPWIISNAGDHEVCWSLLGYVALVIMCAEGSEEICKEVGRVNQLIRFFGNFSRLANPEAISQRDLTKS